MCRAVAGDLQQASESPPRSLGTYSYGAALPAPTRENTSCGWIYLLRELLDVYKWYKHDFRGAKLTELFRLANETSIPCLRVNGVRRLTYIMDARLQIESLALYSLQTVALVVLPLVERCYTLANQPDLWDCSRFPVNFVECLEGESETSIVFPCRPFINLSILRKK
jgi:hypothetical protein